MTLKRSIKKAANNAYRPIKERLKKHYRPKQYVKKWGKEKGLALYNEIFNYKEIGELCSLDIPNYPYHIHLRKGTSDEPTLRQVFMNIRYELDLPFKPKTILDGGANVGYASVFFSEMYPEAEVLSVEPEATNYELVLKNTRSYPKINTIMSAIWGSTTYLKIVNLKQEKWAFEVEEAEESEEGSFKAYSIIDLMKQQNWTSIDILKLDIEGSEISVFEKDYEEWLPNVKLLIIELHENMRPGCTAIFEKAINRYNFKASVSGENLIYINQNK